MHNLDAFIVADDKIDFDATRAAPAVAGQSVRLGLAAKAALLDLETAGMFIACATSAINYAARHPHLASQVLLALPPWLPTSPASVRTVQIELLKDDLPLSVCSALRDLGLHLRIAGRATRLHCEKVAARAPVSPTQIDELVSLWGLLSERTVALIQTLGPLAASTEPSSGKPTDCGPASERLLAAAALGHWPCIGERGTIAIPGWIERRVERRHRIRLECRLVEAGRTWRAHTIDISRSGVGLAGAPPLAPGARASIAIGALAEQHGCVVWSNGERLGFRFDTPLESLADLGRSLLTG
ncbi:MAG: PilZ domain-containing protein [Hyphomicrobiaceae bacterium]